MEQVPKIIIVITKEIQNKTKSNKKESRQLARGINQ